jgi:hypothetical protein
MLKICYMRVNIGNVFTCQRKDTSDGTTYTRENYRKFGSYNKRWISDHVVGYLSSQEELSFMDLIKRGILSLLYAHKFGTAEYEVNKRRRLFCDSSMWHKNHRRPCMLILRGYPVWQTQTTVTARLVTFNLTHPTDHLRPRPPPAYCKLSLVSSLRPVWQTR